MATLYAIPAYGRRYNGEEDLLASWEEGKDFKIYNGPYFSIRDSAILKASYDKIEIAQTYMPLVSVTIDL